MLYVRRKNRDPLHAADFLRNQRGGQAVDALLGVLVEDLHDLFREHDLAVAVGQQRLFRGVQSEVKVQATGLEQGFLREVTEADGVGVGRSFGHVSRFWVDVDP